MTIKYNFFGKNCLIERDLEDRENLNDSLKEAGFESVKTLFVNNAIEPKIAPILKDPVSPINTCAG